MFKNRQSLGPCRIAAAWLIALAAVAFGGPAVAQTDTPLTAEFSNAPTLHDGIDEFSVSLSFSENVDLNPGAFAGGLLTIANGELTGQRRVAGGGANQNWQISVRPNGVAAVVITLPTSSAACASSSVPCTSDGRKLSASVSVTVPGPEQPAETTLLTATFNSASGRHNGTSTFKVILGFSENVKLNSRAFGGGLLTITGGTRTAQTRHSVDGEGKNQNWEIEVTPSGTGDVVITLPTSEAACDPNSVPCTAHGRKLSASVSVTVPGPDLTASLTATFNSVPTSHDSTNKFAVILHFSENVALSATAFGRGLLTITGGTQTAHRRHSVDGEGRDQNWEIEVTPIGTSDVVITLPASDAACASSSVPCTPDGRKLSASVSVTVPGPGQPAETTPLTATFNGAPQRHNGTRTFTVILHFSENVALNSRAFGGGLLTITGGTRTDQRRHSVDGEGQNQNWEIEVTPSGTSNVVITLPTSAAACDQNSVPCTSDGRKLSASASVTVPFLDVRPTSLMAEENQTGVATLTATGPDTPASDLTWEIPSGTAGGADGGKFMLSTAGVLTFGTKKDFEKPDDANRNGIYEITVQVSKGDVSITADITVRLTDGNDAPTADAGEDQTGVRRGSRVTLPGSGSDVDPGQTQNLQYAWTQTGLPAVTLTAASSPTASFYAPTDLTETTTLTFTLRVTDEGGLSDEDTVTVTVTTDLAALVVRAPTAYAGEDQTNVSPTVTVTLNGSGYDPDAGQNQNLQYAWTQTGVPAVTLTGASSPTASFNAPTGLTETTTLTFTLRVTDEDGSYNEDTVAVTVLPGEPFEVEYILPAVPNHDGVNLMVILRFSEPADLDVRAFSNGLLTITGGSVTSAGRRGGTNQQWNIWIRPDGDGEVTIALHPSAAACDRNSVPCTSNGKRLLSGDSVTVPGPAALEAPRLAVDPTELSAAENQTAVATLTATGTDAQPSELEWEIIGGADREEFTLSAAGVLAFKRPKDYENADDADSDRGYEVTVQVSDGSATVTANLRVKLANVNEAPVADAGDNVFGATPGVVVTLQSRSRDPDYDVLEYTWSHVSGPSVTFFTNDRNGQFTVPDGLSDGTVITVKLTVTDPDGLQDEDTLAVTVGDSYPASPVFTGQTSFNVPENQRAVATLAATDADTNAAELTWSLATDSNNYKTDNSRFELSSAGALTFALPKNFEKPDDHGRNGIYEISVQVSDGGRRTVQNLTVTLMDVNEPPAAMAGDDQSGVLPGATVVLQGSGTDPDDGDGDSLTYAWTQIGVPTVTLTGGSTQRASFSAPTGLTEAATLTFVLTVTDPEELSGQDRVTVGVLGPVPLSLDADIAGDDTVNIAEKAAGFAISGNTGSEVGAAVTVTVGTGTLSATSADDGNGTATWSVRVPPSAAYITSPNVTVTVGATKTGFTPAGAERTLTVDLLEPTAPSYTAPSELKVGEAIAAMSPSGGVDVEGYEATDLPSGLSIDAATGVIGGMPSRASSAVASATVTVTDGAENSADASITFPAVSKGEQTLAGFGYGSTMATLGSAAPAVTAPTVMTPTGATGGGLSYTAAPEAVCTVTATSGELTLVAAGECEVTVTAAATDDYEEKTATFTVTVRSLGTLELSLDADITG
ncbi:MAG: putative Ig domain-containing protein, partial [Immundisolibacterales bacterium]|nr:putative Ig domain-containing protein [Immundisolibacterales bacterium]